MSALVARITAVLREELGFQEFAGDQLFEGAIDTRELAERVAAEVQHEQNRQLVAAWNAGFKEGMRKANAW